MKKNLLICNVVLYAVKYSISLFYIGCQYGRQRYFGSEHMLLPLTSLVFLLIGIGLVRNYEWTKVKSYCAMAGTTLGLSGLFWGWLLLNYFRGGLWSDAVMDVVTYPGSLFCLSVIIAAFYLVCAMKTKKESTGR